MPIPPAPAAPPSAQASADPPADWYRSLIENSHDLVSILAPDGRIIYDNPSVERVLGYAQGELVGMNAFELVHPDDLRGALELLAETATTPGSSASIVLRFRHKDKSWRVLESVGKSLRGPGSEPQVVINSRDVTEAVHATTDLAEAKEELARRVCERNREVEEAHVEMLERLARASEFRDDETGEHTRRVGAVATLLAQVLALPADEVELIRRTAPLHDIGKIGISDAILRKPGPLTPDELEVMRGHTLLGSRILSGGRSEFMRSAECVALRHHERWDGHGYPHHLKGDDIPLIARIVAIADFFDALTHDRPYRKAWPRERVFAEIERESGHHFDPVLADRFLCIDELTLLEA
ncbi:MAG TPA: HD domain-containing phosphohydrolase [Longimicrobiaceae bacterium]|nr:HD domain-containing phosphohydrolase [Longimicrobiaceae bacterium]